MLVGYSLNAAIGVDRHGNRGLSSLARRSEWRRLLSCQSRDVVGRYKQLEWQPSELTRAQSTQNH
eukprot:scaffold153174_cov32-Tisochrysis_lutea.AAC.3